MRGFLGSPEGSKLAEFGRRASLAPELPRGPALATGSKQQVHSILFLVCGKNCAQERQLKCHVLLLCTAAKACFPHERESVQALLA
jgi:hypothetical protein